MAKVLKGGTVVSTVGNMKVDIRIEDEKISNIGKDIYVLGDEVIDVSGYYLLPGGIDVHTHFALDVGTTITADDFTSGTKAALRGGTTTIIDFINHKKGKTFTEVLEHYKDLSDNKCYCDYGFHMSICEWNSSLENEMDVMVKKGITTFKLYMAYKNLLQVEDDVIEKVLIKAKELGVLLSFHCEDGDAVYENINKLILDGKTEPKYHEISRNDDIELKAVKRLLEISNKVDYPVYIVHLSCKKSLEEVRVRRQKGVNVIVETCPQYLLLDKSLYEGTENDLFQGAKYVISPPLRSKEDNEVLWNGIKNNEIQVLATDHCSFNYLGQKEIGRNNFSKIPNGAPGVEHRMQLAYSYGVCRNIITLNKLVEVTAENPAKIFGLFPQKGILAEGSDADILVIKCDDNSKITWKEQTQNVDYTPYEGFEKKMYIKSVYLRGREVVKDNEVLLDNPRGNFQRREVYKRGD